MLWSRVNSFLTTQDYSNGNLNMSFWISQKRLLIEQCIRIIYTEAFGKIKYHGSGMNLN